jgi:hypothetical protein
MALTDANLVDIIPIDIIPIQSTECLFHLPLYNHQAGDTKYDTKPKRSIEQYQSIDPRVLPTDTLLFVIVIKPGIATIGWTTNNPTNVPDRIVLI